MSNSLFDVLALLDARNISYFIEHNCKDTITIYATLASRRVEIYVHESNEIDFSVFRGKEDVVIGFDALKNEIDID